MNKTYIIIVIVVLIVGGLFFVFKSKKLEVSTLGRGSEESEIDLAKIPEVTLEKCLKLENLKQKDECIYYLARKDRNLKLCPLLTDKLTVKVCNISAPLGQEMVFLKLNYKDTAIPGELVGIRGKVTNATRNTIYLNSILGSGRGSKDGDFLFDSQPFFELPNYIINPGESIEGLIGYLAIGQLVSQEDYSGSIDIQGGADEYSYDYPISKNFEIKIK